MQPTIFVLGPSLNNVFERGSMGIAVAQVAGKRGVSFHSTTPTLPGGIVNIKLNPPLNPGDKLPINVYAFFVQPVESVPLPADLTPDWFFKSGANHGFVPVTDTADTIPVTVKAVQPSLKPYFVQIVLEYAG